MTQRVDFTKILRAAFTHTDPKSAKKDSQLKQLFALLGSAEVKAARKHSDEIDHMTTKKLNHIYEKSEQELSTNISFRPTYLLQLFWPGVSILTEQINNSTLYSFKCSLALRVSTKLFLCKPNTLH